MKKLISAVLSVVMALSLVTIPVLAAPTDAAPVKVPEGYNVNDYTKLHDFLEIEDEEGTKNGTKVNPDYDPDDPATWSADGGLTLVWSESETDKRIVNVSYSSYGASAELCGKLDLSGCTELRNLYCQNNLITGLDVSGCTNLSSLNCQDNRITELDLHESTAIFSVSCQNNLIASINLSGCEGLMQFDCSNNLIENLDLSACTSLNSVNCVDNKLTSLDLTANTRIANVCKSINAEGNGYIGIRYDSQGKYVWAKAFEGCTFDGWYAPDGEEPISTENSLTIADVLGGATTDTDEFIAKFSGEAQQTEEPTDTPEEPTDTPEMPTNTPEEPTDTPEIPSDPSVYNEHDYNKLRAFLEITDENGEKNGEKLNRDNYDPDDPSTWGLMDIFYTTWSDSETDKRLIGVNYGFAETLCGKLDLSGCTELEELACQFNQITELDVTGCTALKNLYCLSNELTELDVSSCTALEWLYCAQNMLTEFDISGNDSILYISIS